MPKKTASDSSLSALAPFLCRHLCPNTSDRILITRATSTRYCFFMIADLSVFVNYVNDLFSHSCVSPAHSSLLMDTS